MTGEPNCLACVVFDLSGPLVCTGRPGCVRAELREAEEAMRRGERPTTGPATEPHPAAGVFACDQCEFLGVEGHRCTGRPGCLKSYCTTLVTQPTGIVEQDEPHVAAAIEAVRGVERGKLMAHLGPHVVVLPKEEHDRYHEIVVQQRAEIARLRAEVERLTQFVEFKRAEVAAMRGTVERLRGQS